MKKTSFYSKSLIALPLVLSASLLTAQAQDDKSSNKKEEGNRNVMLNAASANGPREIQIGLPSADVNVLENGLPVTYATNPHSVNSTWRSDASLSHVGLLKIAETAITTGNIGYAVNSFTNLGQEGFHGTLNYKTNHFGLSEFSLNVNGGLKNGWFYSGSIYQDFDQEPSSSSRLPSRTARRSIRVPSRRSMPATAVRSPPCISTPTAIPSTPMPLSRPPSSMWATEA